MVNRHVLVAHQPAYLPWGGYFSRLLDVDRLIVLDHVQFSERGRQHRNHIRAPDGGTIRLTVPVRRRFGQRLYEVRIADEPWALRHWRSITHSYQRAPYWARYADQLAELYAQPWTHLTDLDIALTGWVLKALGMHIDLVRSSTLAPRGTKTQMLIELCHRTETCVLRVGTGATGYLNTRSLSAAGIDVQVATFTDPTTQAHTPTLSALDTLLHHGPRTRDVLAEGSVIRPWVGWVS